MQDIIKILERCHKVLQSKRPEDIDSFIDDNKLVEKVSKILSKETGKNVGSDADQVEILEALLGLNFFHRDFSDRNDTFDIRFISTPSPTLVLTKISGSKTQNIVYPQQSPKKSLFKK